MSKSYQMLDLKRPTQEKSTYTRSLPGSGPFCQLLLNGWVFG